MKILSKLDNTGMIEETADKRYVTDAEKLTWNSKADKTYVDSQDALKADKTAVEASLELKADKSYVDSKVKTDVPSGAKFTDTITTINGKTGAITKADITALGIPAQDTVVDISGKADKTYVDGKVKTDVPVGAKFTDTVYSHPATHSADMITDGTTNKVYTSAEKTKLSGIAANANNYSHPTGDGNKHVPANGTTNNGKVLKAGATAGTYTWSNDNDTVTTINGKTGAITKADIVALGIPAQDTVVDISGKADKTYVDNKVKTDVPVGAKFTDTVYTHPASHPASMITGLPTSLPANGGNADTVGGFTVGVNVPANAKFTDTNTTYSEISTAEIDAGTASTLRTITGRRVKYILDKVQGWISGLTKSDVGLGNVDNTSDASKPISTATQTALNGKVNNSQVLTNVPSGAKFTDTITTINNKTGAISKADITALGIPAQDTVYSHPATHPASMITESSTKRFVSDSEKSTWNSKSDTDTVTTINGKTGAISKADIVALGIPASDTNTTYTEITTAEIDAGTSSTRRTITGRRVKYILDKVGSPTWSSVTSKPATATRWPSWSEVTSKPDVIDSTGSNTNGRYIKFTDGTMICYRESFTLTVVWSQAVSANWTFPASFNSTSVTVLPSFDLVTDPRRGKLNIFTRNTTRTKVEVLVAADEAVFTTGDTQNCKLMAIGRWK